MNVNMECYAEGNGTALLKDNINKNELFWKLDKKIKEAYYLEYDYDKDKTIHITDSVYYREKDIVEFLNILSSYITEGTIKYTGDDDTHWKFVFNAKTEEWNKLKGEIYYSLDEFSDNMLIEEINSRGYTVVKEKLNFYCRHCKGRFRSNSIKDSDDELFRISIPATADEYEVHNEQLLEITEKYHCDFLGYDDGCGLIDIGWEKVYPNYTTMHAFLAEVNQAFS